MQRWPTAQQFYNQIGANLPENIGLAMAPMEITSFDFEKSGTNTENDRIRAAEQSFWSASGVSSLNFNNEKASNNALLQSIRSDESIVWGLLSQIERWLNRYLKYQSGTQKFHVIMPHISVYNQKEVAEELLKGAQFGIPTKLLYGAAIGMEQSEMMGLAFLENDVLQLQDNLIPLSSAHTQSGKANSTIDGGGRPTNESKGKSLSEAGEINQNYK